MSGFFSKRIQIAIKSFKFFLSPDFFSFVFYFFGLFIYLFVYLFYRIECASVNIRPYATILSLQITSELSQTLPKFSQQKLFLQNFKIWHC